MGIFSEMSEAELGLDIDRLVESYLVDDLTHNYGEDTIREFCSPGGTGDALVEAKVLGKRTLVRLSKVADVQRREHIAALQMAREANDALYTKLVQVQAKRKDLLAAIYKKYGSKAQKAAVKGQKEYIKTMRKVPKSFMNMGGADRV